MDREKFEILAMEYLSGTISESDREAFEKLLKNDESHSNAYNELVDTWSKVETLDAPEPSLEMDNRFFAALSEEMEAKKKNREFWNSMQGVLSGLFKPQLVYGILLVGVGLAIGLFLNSNNADLPDQNPVVVDNETEKVRQQLVLTLLDQPSANQRLQGVSEANKISSVDSIVVKALLQTLNNDPNVNVRLAAIESLTNYADQPIVRQGLVQSIAHQESPILQVTLANLMVALQEKASIEPFRELLKEKELDTTVKKKIENSIESII